MAASVVRHAVVCASALLAACGGHGGGGSAPPPTTYTIGGTLSGLSGTGLVLRNNAGNDLAVAASGNFTFSTALAGGAAYNVTVATQPTSPSQTCAVTGGSGTVGTANVATVQVACTTNSFTVGATVTGLDANGLVLQNNGGNDLTVASDGTVTFPGQTSSGAAFAITVKTQPTISPFPLPAQFCTVTNGSGTVGNGPVNVAIACLAPVFRRLYVSNRNGNNLSAYSINASTGELTELQGSPFAAGVRPSFTSPEPSARFAYTSNQGDGTTPPHVSAYTVDTATGVLTPIPGQPYPFSVTPQPPGSSFFNAPIMFVHRSGAFGYASTTMSGTGVWRLFGASINSLTGELTEISGFPMDIGYTPAGMTQDSGGRVAFVVTHATPAAPNGEIRTFTINSPSGTLTPVGTFPTAGAEMAFPVVTPGDNFVLIPSRGASTIEVFAVGKSGDVPNGVLTAVGAPVPTGPPGSQPFAIAFNRRNNVFYVSHLDNVNPPILSTFRLDPSTGAVTAIGTPISTNGARLASANLHPSGRFLLQYNNATASLQVFAIDPTTFAPTLQPNPTPLPQVPVVDFSGKYLYVANGPAGTVSSYRIDTTTGALTLVNTVPAGLFPTAVSPFGFQPQ
jgi:6-phosphogluconolactonase (cycloisomerase 2 family)